MFAILQAQHLYKGPKPGLSQVAFCRDLNDPCFSEVVSIIQPINAIFINTVVQWSDRLSSSLSHLSFPPTVVSTGSSWPGGNHATFQLRHAKGTSDIPFLLLLMMLFY